MGTTVPYILDRAKFSEALTTAVGVSGLDKDLVYAQGYSSVADSGAAPWVYRLTGRSGVTLGKFKIAGPGADDYYELLNKDIVNAKSVGMLGDDSTDNAATFTSIIADMPVGGVLEIPEGTYRVSSTITVNKAIAIVGSGTIKETTGLAPVFEMSGNNAIVSGIAVQGSETQASFEAGPLDGTEVEKAAFTVSGDGVVISSVTVTGKSCGIKAEGDKCVFTSSVLNGLFSSAPAGGQNWHQAFAISGDKYIISNNQMYNWGAGLTAGISLLNSTITGNRVEDCYDNGLYFSSAFYVTITGNSIRNISGTGIKVRGANNTIDGNTVELVTTSGIVMSPLAGYMATDYIARIIIFNSGSVEPQMGETLTGATSGVTAVVRAVYRADGNWSDGDAVGYIYLEDDPSGEFSAENINGSVSGSNICTRVEKAKVGGWGNIASNNTVIDANAYGIVVDDVTNYWTFGCRIVGNTIVDCGVETNFSAVRLYGPDHVVADNLIQGGNLAGIYLDAEDDYAYPVNILITGNTIFDAPTGIICSRAANLRIVDNPRISGMTYNLSATLCDGLVISDNNLEGQSLLNSLNFDFSENNVNGDIYCRPTFPEVGDYIKIRENHFRGRTSAPAIIVRLEGGMTIDLLDVSRNHIRSNNYGFFLVPHADTDTGITIKRLVYDGNDIYTTTSSIGNWFIGPTSGSAIDFTADTVNDRIESVGHGLTEGTVVVFTGSDLPDPLVANQNYYVLSSPGADWFQVSATEGGSAVDLTDAGSGTITYKRKTLLTINSMTMLGGHYQHANEALFTIEADTTGDFVMQSVTAFHSKNNTAENIFGILNGTFETVRITHCTLGHPTLVSGQCIIESSGEVHLSHNLLNRLTTTGGFSFGSAVADVISTNNINNQVATKMTAPSGGRLLTHKDAHTGIVHAIVTGTPEAALTAPVGSIAVDDSGSTSTTLYVKESGTGNTGWVAK